MFRLSMAGAAGALWLAAAPVAAEPFESFTDLCLATNADAGAGEVAAKSSGWRDVTAQMAADGGDMVEGFQDVALYINFDPARPESLPPDQAPELLMTGWGDGEAVMDMKGVVLDLCGVMSPAADALTLGKQLTDYLGMSASTDGEHTFWLYSRGGDGFVSEAALADAEDEVIMAETRNRSLYAVYVLEEEGMAGLFVGAVRPEAKAGDR